MAEIVSRIYSNFRGVDFRGEEINLVRSPDALNVWKDYKQTESIRTRPGLELGVGSEDPVYGIFEYNGEAIIHSGKQLYQLRESGNDLLYTNMAQKPSQAFVYEGIFYIKDGTQYLQYDGSAIKEVEGYIPTTSIARKPMGGGTKYEDVNMLSDYRINTFLATGVDFDFFLDTINIDEDYAPIVKVNDEVVSADNYTVYYAEGRIQFHETPPEVPLTDGQDNVSIQFKKAVPRYRELIEKCTMLQVFDNRVFFSGNADMPNMLWHCSLNDPSYVSDLDYYKEGMDMAAIKGMVAGNNALWVFREPSSANTTVFYHTPTIDEQYGKIYPSTHSSVTTGCVGKAINFNDDIVFFSERGMEGISGDVTTEQVVAHRSSLVDRKMTAEPKYRNMSLAEWEGYLCVIIGNKVYLADSRSMFTNENHMEYEWFYWDIGVEVTCALAFNGYLYLGTESGVYVIGAEKKGNVESYWTTPKDKFKYPHKLKTTNKRGCVAEAEGDISVYAKTEDTEFELIGEYMGVTDYFVSRIKRKKWKDIQLKFYSSTRFSLETVTLEAFVGGYIKR
jgi:hypothetical protein